MCTGRPCTRVLRALCMRQAESARAAVAILERSRSRLRLNTLFGESQVPGWFANDEIVFTVNFAKFYLVFVKLQVLLSCLCTCAGYLALKVSLNVTWQIPKEVCWDLTVSVMLNSDGSAVSRITQAAAHTAVKLHTATLFRFPPNPWDWIQGSAANQPNLISM